MAAISLKLPQDLLEASSRCATALKLSRGAYIRQAVERMNRETRAAYALHLLGDIATHPDRFDAESGEAHYRQALALAEPRGMRPLVAHCHLGLGKHRHTGKQQEAQDHRTVATTMYREMDMPFWLEQAEAELRRP